MKLELQGKHSNSANHEDYNMDNNEDKASKKSTINNDM